MSTVDPAKPRRTSLARTWSFVVELWDVLRRPSSVFGLGVLVFAGLVSGVVFWGGFNTALELTNTDKFCPGCHEMRDNVFSELKTTIHFSNRSGVRASCPDCHVPHNWTDKIARKMQASKEVWGHLFGSIDSREKFVDHRLELALHEWARFKANVSLECRNCHSAQAMDITKLARHIADGVDGEVKFAAFTGKAALVMRNKGCDNPSTIHSLIYRARESGVEQPSFELWDDAPASKAKLIVIDECSMVDAELGRDLMSFECPLLVLGDPAQLPPIQGGAFLTDCAPDAMLTDEHRQAQNDPIVRMSMDVREGRELDIGRYGETQLVSRSELDPDRVMGADQVLVGRNNTRRAYNMRVRQKQNIEDPLPVAGDKLVCLRNNRKKGLFNGGLWRGQLRAPSHTTTPPAPLP